MAVRKNTGVRQCDICPKAFVPKSPQHIHCCRRCAYIAVKLGRVAARCMDRDVAIAFYGSQYDDPLRHIHRGTSRQIMRHVINFCEKFGTVFVSRQDIEAYSGKKLKAKALALVARDVPALSYFAKSLEDDGSTRELYRFLEEDLVSNADARDRNKQVYHER